MLKLPLPRRPCRPTPGRAAPAKSPAHLPPQPRRVKRGSQHGKLRRFVSSKSEHRRLEEALGAPPGRNSLRRASRPQLPHTMPSVPRLRPLPFGPWVPTVPSPSPALQGPSPALQGLLSDTSLEGANMGARMPTWVSTGWGQGRPSKFVRPRSKVAPWFECCRCTRPHRNGLRAASHHTMTPLPVRDGLPTKPGRQPSLWPHRRRVGCSPMSCSSPCPFVWR